MKIISFLRAIILKNWPAKVVCLLFAGGLWAWVMVQQATERRFDVEINFYEMPSEHVIGEDTQRTVSVTLRGPQTVVNRLEAEELAVDMNLSGLAAGTERIQILPWHVRNPDRTEVVEIEPRSIRVDLVERISSEVEVRPGLVGEPREGYNYEVEVVPDTALISGPRQHVGRITELELDGVRFPEPEESTRQTTAEVVLPPEVQLEYPAQNLFSVEIKVYEDQVERIIENVPVELTGLTEDELANIRMEPSTVDVGIVGSAAKVDAVDSGEIQATVTVSEFPEEPRLERVNLIVPEDLRVTEESRQEKTVRIERAVD